METFKQTRTWSIVALLAALLCLAGTIMAILGTRLGWWGFRDAAGMLRWAVQAGAVLLALSAIVFVLARRAREARSQMLSGAAALLLLIPVIGIPLNRVARPLGDPINDITTDTANPPAFEAVIPLRPEGSNPVEYGGEAVAARQEKLYPDIGPIESPLAAADAFARVVSVAEDMGWEVVATDAARGVVEAVDTTRFFNYKDDIVVRIRGTAAGSRIDLRSRSRVGRSDLGKNAARIREFTERFAAE